MTDHRGVLVFDVNETLSDIKPLARRFTEVGAPAELLQVWFAGVLRDGFALTVVGASQPFAVLAHEHLRAALRTVPIDRDVDAAAGSIMAEFAALGVHADVPDGIRALRGAGYRLVTLSNGAADVAEQLLTGAGVRPEFDQLLSVEDAGIWKPAGAAYTYAADRCGVDVADMTLVAAHPWDIDGASRAGLQTVWVNRDNTSYPSYFSDPAVTVSGLGDLARRFKP